MKTVELRKIEDEHPAIASKRAGLKSALEGGKWHPALGVAVDDELILYPPHGGHVSVCGDMLVVASVHSDAYSKFIGLGSGVEGITIELHKTGVLFKFSPAEIIEDYWEE